MRNRLGIVVAVALALAVALLWAVPMAGAVVPPGNSAVNQYTETYPTSNGNSETGSGGGRSPAQALGKKNAQRLQSKGAEGRAAAEVAAETAPGGSAGAGGGQGSGAGAGGGGGGKGGQPTARPGGGAQPDGSSGLGEAIGSATGSSSSGELGLLLPLVILISIVGSAAYAWRRRQQAT